MKRLFDFIVAFLSLLLLSVPMGIIAVLIKFTSQGPVVYWSDRVGKNNLIFKMPKFRTMHANTPPMATHLMTDPTKFLTPVGKLLRKTSLDELPQLFSILRGDMSFVGPRPALFNQADLIELRTSKGVHQVLPGLTGWAQINGRDELSVSEKVSHDEYYLKNRSFLFDLRVIFLTAIKVLRASDVSH